MVAQNNLLFLAMHVHFPYFLVRHVSLVEVAIVVILVVKVSIKKVKLIQLVAQETFICAKLIQTRAYCLILSFVIFNILYYVKIAFLIHYNDHVLHKNSLRKKIIVMIRLQIFQIVYNFIIHILILIILRGQISKNFLVGFDFVVIEYKFFYLISILTILFVWIDQLDISSRRNKIMILNLILIQ